MKIKKRLINLLKTEYKDVLFTIVASLLVTFLYMVYLRLYGLPATQQRLEELSVESVPVLTTEQ